MIVEKQMECRLGGETEVLGENLPQRHFCPASHYIPLHYYTNYAVLLIRFRNEITDDYGINL
jgi:hypothetical protein